MNESYFLINTQTNPQICENVIIWNGDKNIWNPPAGYILLLQKETLCHDWKWNSNSSAWELTELGIGGIGFTWDGTKLTTNEPQPTEPPIVIDTQVDNF
jgi:hypothetical protein